MLSRNLSVYYTDPKLTCITAGAVVAINLLYVVIFLSMSLERAARQNMAITKDILHKILEISRSGNK